MSCGCKSGSDIQSWNDFNNVAPQDPLDLIALAVFTNGAAITGTWTQVINYRRPLGASPWIASPLTISGESLVTTNGTDQIQNVSDADQWNFSHTTSNIASTTAPPLRKTVFMRAGTNWTNTVPIALSAAMFTELQLSFMENAATRGDAQATIPVIQWLGVFTGASTLSLVLKQRGRFTLGLNAIDNGLPPNYSMFELDIIAI